MMRFKDIITNKDIWLFASEVEKVNNNKYRFAGNSVTDSLKVSFKVTIEVPTNIKAVKVTYDFSVADDIDNYQACLQFHSDFVNQWKCHMYPWAADAKYIQRDPLNWMGIPSLFQYREDMSLGMLWGIDPNSDYLNPTTWTKDFGLYFIDGQISILNIVLAVKH
ncbi:MAG: hypothetical protein U5K00_16250 [Melioribacteraceae bacterium]|nr:hypothetical protein [Melioribacteraceae bacterium]